MYLFEVESSSGLIICSFTASLISLDMLADPVFSRMYRGFACFFCLKQSPIGIAKYGIMDSILIAILNCIQAFLFYFFENIDRSAFVSVLRSDFEKT